MPTVIRDDSIGQALGTLASGIMGNPKDAWEAQAYKQRIAQVQAETAKAQLEMQDMRRQQQAQSGLVSQFNTMFQPGNFNVPQTVEAPRPAAAGFQGPMRPGEVAPGVQGPMPGMHNPQADNLDQKLAFARAAAANAVMRGGNPNDALSAAYAALGMGQVLASGVPTNELGARQTQTMLTGQIPDAKVALTEGQRLTNVAETEASKLKEAVPIGANGTLLTPQQAGVLNVPADDNGQFIVRPPADPAAAGASGPFGGTSMEAQASNIILTYQDMVRSGQPISPQMEAQANLAWQTLYGTNDELRSGPNGSTMMVPVTPRAPNGFVQPGAGTVPAPPAPVSGALPAPPVSGAVPAPPAPVSGAPADPNGVRTVIPGTVPKDTEAVMRKRQFVDTMKVSKQGMDALLDQGGYVPSFDGQILNKLATRADGTLTTDLVAAIANGAMRAEDQQYWTAAGNFLNAVLRDESGAAVPEQEYPRYLAALIPQSGDSPERIAQKRQLMQAAIAARENAFLSERPGAAREVAAMIAASPTFYPEAAGAAQAPAAGTPDRVRLRQEADDAIATIEASNLPSSVKMQKKALIEQKFNQMTGGQ